MTDQAQLSLHFQLIGDAPMFDDPAVLDALDVDLMVCSTIEGLVSAKRRADVGARGLNSQQPTPLRPIFNDKTDQQRPL